MVSYGCLLPEKSMPEFPLNLLLKVRVGNCDSYASRNVAQMRAIGLPAAKDFTPQWGNRSMGHSWAVLLPEDDLAFPFGQMSDWETTFSLVLNINYPKFSGKHLRNNRKCMI